VAGTASVVNQLETPATPNRRSSIRQSNASWFGHGMEGFIERLGMEYEDRPGDTSESTPHRGMAVWVGPCGPASAMVISGQSRPEANFVEQLTVGLITRGYPIRRQFIDAIDALPAEFGNAHEWNCPTYSVGGFHRRDILIDNGIEISRREYDNPVDELVFKNPFHGRPRKIAKMLDFDEDEKPGRISPDRMCESLANYEQLRCHVKTPYAPSKDPDGYEVTRFEITDLAQMTENSVSAVNVRIKVQPNL
jgi:hypothetical protein